MNYARWRIERAFALVPAVIYGLNWLIGDELLRTRDVPLLWRAVFALMLAVLVLQRAG